MILWRVNQPKEYLWKNREEKETRHWWKTSAFSPSLSSLILPPCSHWTDRIKEIYLGNKLSAVSTILKCSQKKKRKDTCFSRPPIGPWYTHECVENKGPCFSSSCWRWWDYSRNWHKQHFGISGRTPATGTNSDGLWKSNTTAGAWKMKPSSCPLHPDTTRFWLSCMSAGRPSWWTKRQTVPAGEYFGHDYHLMNRWMITRKQGTGDQKWRLFTLMKHNAPGNCPIPGIFSQVAIHHSSSTQLVFRKKSSGQLSFNSVLYDRVDITFFRHICKCSPDVKDLL